MKKIYNVEVKTRLIMQLDEDAYVDNVISEMDYNFTSQSDNADIVDTEILDYEVTSVK